MDTPFVCLSQHFVNKQNLRSFGNILNYGVLKSEDNQMFGAEENLMKDLSPGLLSIIAEIKLNLRMKSKRDFKEYFEIDDTTIHLHPVNKQVVFKSSWKALCDIVPRKLFGDSNQNFRTLRRLVESSIYSMRRQHFMIGKFIDRWDFSSALWETPVETGAKNILLCHILLWILKNILSPVISLNFYVTTCKVDGDENKLHYFWKNQWQSFYDKKISEMIFTKVIKKCETYCLGKKIKRNHSLNARLKLKYFKKAIPKLHLILKAKNNYRPIVQYKTNPQNTIEKYKIKERLNFLKILIGKPKQKIETLYAELLGEWLKLSQPKLYFIKTDLSNAFGAVNKEQLLRILSEKHIAVQNKEKNINLKKKYAQQFKDMMTELRRPLLIRSGSTVFEWKEGLVQGYKYSPALSELYYDYMDETYFSEFFRKSEATIKLFTRVVDDYLYITNSLQDAHLFLNTLTNYRNVNYGKTEVNFQNDNFKFSEEITFLGYAYNTVTMHVSRATNAFVGQMCYKISFTGAIMDVNKFLENRISQSGIPINSHIFNFWHNPEELVWTHIFTTFCFSANKFCTILAILCEEKEMVNYLGLYKKRVVVKLSNAIVNTLRKNKKADFMFVFCSNHFCYLSWKALYLCAKGTPKCSNLLSPINDELAKTNCLFGKWRDHASTINTSGVMLQAATKETCRRSDLRVIVKKFDKLPKGFECYHHRKIE